MRQLLKEVSQSSVSLGDMEFSEAQVRANWLGNEPASDKEIIEAEKRLGVNLPGDYKAFLKECNGFHAPNDVEPTFLPIDKIDYLENIDPYLVGIWMRAGTAEIGNELRKSILVGGLNEEQYFLLIPSDVNSEWRYWKFASWIPGEAEYKDLSSYWNDVLEFNKEQLRAK